MRGVVAKVAWLAGALLLGCAGVSLPGGDGVHDSGDGSDGTHDGGTHADGTHDDGTHDDGNEGSPGSPQTDGGDSGEVPDCPEGSAYYVPSPGTPSALTEAGCYVPCPGTVDQPCDSGGICRLVWIDPCWNSPCAADGAEEALCIDEPASCADVGDGPAFSTTPALDDTVNGTADCTVTAVDPLSLSCSGAFAGAYTVAFAGVSGVSVEMDASVSLSSEVIETLDYTERSLTLLDEEGALIAAGIEAAHISEDWNGLSLVGADLHCGPIACEGVGGTVTRRGVDAAGTIVAPGEVAVAGLPGAGYEIAVHESHQGSCANTANAWHAVTVAWNQ